jgi:hypothetical protein
VYLVGTRLYLRGSAEVLDRGGSPSLRVQHDIYYQVRARHVGEDYCRRLIVEDLFDN